MQAIVTKYYGPTNTKPSKFRAICSGGKIAASFDYDKDEFCQQRDLAWKLCEKMGWWRSDLVMETGTLPDGTLCHVFMIGR